jgi:hypothetical protein
VQREPAKIKPPSVGLARTGVIGDEKHQTNRAPTGRADHIVANAFELVSFKSVRSITVSHFDLQRTTPLKRNMIA